MIDACRPFEWMDRFPPAIGPEPIEGPGMCGADFPLKVAAAAWIHAGSSHHTAFSLAVGALDLKDEPTQLGVVLAGGALAAGGGPTGTVALVPMCSIRQ